MISRRWLVLGATGAAAGAAALSARRVRRVVVSGPSMRPTLEAGDRLVVVRDRLPRPGELAAVRDPRNARRVIVKRVIALHGRGRHLVLRGDNAEASVDSRHFGPVERGALQGRVVYRYFPPERRGRLHV